MPDPNPKRPTPVSVSATLRFAGWAAYRKSSHGYRLSQPDPSTVRVDYDPGSYPIDRAESLANMAAALRRKGWTVTEDDTGRLLVQGTGTSRPAGRGVLEDQPDAPSPRSGAR